MARTNDVERETNDSPLPDSAVYIAQVFAALAECRAAQASGDIKRMRRAQHAAETASRAAIKFDGPIRVA